MAVDSVSPFPPPVEVGTKNASFVQQEKTPTVTETIKKVTEEIKVKNETKPTDTDTLKKELTRITDALNKEMDPLGTNVRFGFNDKIEEMYVSVIEASSNRVIRKIPSDEAMRLMAKMREISGIIFDKKA